MTALAKKLVELHGTNTTVSSRKVHEYLGMDIDWASVPGTMIVSMIEEFPEVL